MKRSIKFRAWLPERKEMSVMYGFTLNLNGEVTTQNGAIIMQFTGLHDKNGKEIYEGDILKLESSYRGKGERPCYVIWEGSQWMMQGTMSYSHKDFIGNYSLDHMEIIGNIYENGVLLTK